MNSHLPLNGILGWIPQIVKLSQNRFQAQIRLLELAALVGIVAGLGAIVFYFTTRVTEHYALGVIAGYYPEPRSGGETPMSWLSGVRRPLATFKSIDSSCKSQPIMITLDMASSSCGLGLGNVCYEHINFPTAPPVARQLAVFFKYMVTVKSR